MAEEQTKSGIDRKAAEAAFAEGGTVMHEGRLYRSLAELPDDDETIAIAEEGLVERKTKLEAKKAEARKK